MKKLLLLLFSVAIYQVGSAQTDLNSIARVNKVDGKEAYFMSEPLRDYEVVFDVGTGLKASSVVTGGLINEGVSDKASQFVKKAMKENPNFDAILYSNGKRVVAIRFTGEATAETKGLARVQKVNGVEVYILAEPLRDYEVLNSKGGGLKLKSAVTGGVVNNSIEEDVADFVKRLQRDDASIQAVIYSTGKAAIGVKFSN